MTYDFVSEEFDLITRLVNKPAKGPQKTKYCTFFLHLQISLSFANKILLSEGCDGWEEGGFELRNSELTNRPKAPSLFPSCLRSGFQNSEPKNRLKAPSLFPSSLRSGLATDHMHDAETISADMPVFTSCVASLCSESVDGIQG